MIAGKKRAFTIFELVLILVIITAQLAVLYPFLERSKEKTRSETCQANLKACAVALQIYLNDWDAALPSSAVVADPPGSTPTNAQVADFLTKTGTWPHSQTTRPVSWAQVMSPWLRYPDAVFCPSDKPRSRLSYWWKYAMDSAWRDPVLHARKEPDYNYADKQIVFYEHAGWHVGDAAGIKNGIQINVAYLDSHIATVTIANGPTTYPTAAQERDGSTSMRLGAPMYYNYDNTTSTPHPGVADYIDPRRYSDVY